MYNYMTKKKKIYQHLSGSSPTLTALSDKIKFCSHHTVAQMWKDENTFHSGDILRIRRWHHLIDVSLPLTESNDLLPTLAAHLSSSDHILPIIKSASNKEGRKKVCVWESSVVAHMNKPHGYISAKLCRPWGLACVQELYENPLIYTF